MHEDYLKVGKPGNWGKRGGRDVEMRATSAAVETQGPRTQTTDHSSQAVGSFPTPHSPANGSAYRTAVPSIPGRDLN